MLSLRNVESASQTATGWQTAKHENRVCGFLLREDTVIREVFFQSCTQKLYPRELQSLARGLGRPCFLSLIFLWFALYFRNICLSLLKINLPWSFPIWKFFHLFFLNETLYHDRFFHRLFILAIFSLLVNKSCTLSNFVELARTVVAPNFVPLEVVLS